MEFVRTPIAFERTETSISVHRDVHEKVEMIDNLIELIVFTPRGSFAADPDFGFEYWNHEYSNIHYRNFNNGHSMLRSGLYNEVTKRECQDSIKRSLASYGSVLKHVDVSIELNAVESAKATRKKVLSKYEVSVKVTGTLDDGLGTASPYEKRILFYMEPTAKHISI